MNYCFSEIFVIACCIFVSGADIGSNPFLASLGLNPPAMVPPQTQIVQQSDQNNQTPLPSAPGYVWLQVPASYFNTKPEQPQQNLTTSKPLTLPTVAPSSPPQYAPAIQQPLLSGGSSTSALTVSNPITIAPPQIDNPELRRRCLKPRGQFPSNACNRFVNCWDGLVVEQACPESLVFNMKGYCDFPENVNCNGKPFEGTSPSSGTTQLGITSPGQSSSGSLAPTPSSPTTVNPPAITTLLPVDPALRKKCLKPRGQFPGSSCNTYVNCWDDVIVEQDCPEGLLFSSKGYCDYPHNVDCNNKGPIRNTENPSPCVLENGTFRDKKNCSVYYTCISNNIVATYECPPGFSFNDNLGVCDYSERVDCSKEPFAFQTKDVASFYNTPVSAPLAQRECPLENGMFRDRTNCSVYYFCAGGKIAVTYECPQGFSFNDNIGVCDYSYRVDCSKEPMIFEKKTFVPQIPEDFMEKIDGCSTGSVIRLNPQCTVACRCRETMAEIIQCPQGLAYDSKADKCLHPTVARWYDTFV